ncbi:hypothetical protein NP493_1165g01074 [Ridgeia piscesae]|uniref:Uncharacterized protein n=1 Tax=Ridgeia piscesae TaxID=27915 RepID=A0AAD9KFD2_RIDPI|nr:hypothetical protein NP493_1165g01074 [Ridgeia piscesae]
MNAIVSLQRHTTDNLVESTGLELDPPMSLVKSAQLVDANDDTCVALTVSAMYVYSVGLWNPQPQGKCWFPGLTIKRRVPESIKASFTVTITGRRLVCSTSHFEVFLRRSKWSECELSGKYHRCLLVSGPATTGNEALITCAATCECIGNDCEHVTVNIQTLQESWELCEIGIK